MSFGTVTATSRYILRVTDGAFVVELFLLSDDAHDQQRFARRRWANPRSGRSNSDRGRRGHYETSLVPCRPASKRRGRRPKRHCRPRRSDRLGLRDLVVRPARNAGDSRSGAQMFISSVILALAATSLSLIAPASRCHCRIARGRSQTKRNGWPRQTPKITVYPIDFGVLRPFGDRTSPIAKKRRGP